MNISSHRLLLREITWDDLENIHSLHSYPEVDEYNTLGIPESIDVTREVIKPAIEDQQKEDRNLFYWTIMEKKGEFIGIAGMTLSASRFKLGEI